MLTPALERLDIERRHQTKILARGSRLFDSGELHIHVDRTGPLHQAAAAHAWVEAGQGLGKAVLTIDE